MNGDHRGLQLIRPGSPEAGRPDDQPAGFLDGGVVPRLTVLVWQVHDAAAGIYGTETIERFLISSYDQFASQSSITKYLPLLAERFARQRLHAPGQSRGQTP